MLNTQQICGSDVTLARRTEFLLSSVEYISIVVHVRVISQFFLKRTWTTAILPDMNYIFVDLAITLFFSLVHYFIKIPGRLERIYSLEICR